jgi:hypothetical protein
MSICKSLFRGIAAVALATAFGSTAFGLTITVNRYGGNFATSGGQAEGVGGGEFTITADDPSIVANYNALARVGANGFETFCLEYNQHISVPATYNAEISGGARPGGGGGVNGVDLISIGTAYLYSQFALGVLSGYHYDAAHTGAYANRALSAGALQAAFWFLEQEVTLTDLQVNNNFFLGLLGINSNADATVGAQRADASGYNLHGVAVLNLGASPTFPNQDQLVKASSARVPDGGATLSLLGAALCGISFLRRKIA